MQMENTRNDGGTELSSDVLGVNARSIITNRFIEFQEASNLNIRLKYIDINQIYQVFLTEVKSVVSLNTV